MQLARCDACGQLIEGDRKRGSLGNHDILIRYLPLGAIQAAMTTRIEACGRDICTECADQLIADAEAALAHLAQWRREACPTCGEQRDAIVAPPEK